MVQTKVTPNETTNIYKFNVYQSNTVATSSTSQKVIFNTELFDTNSNFDTSTGRYNVQ